MSARHVSRALLLTRLGRGLGQGLKAPFGTPSSGSVCYSTTTRQPPLPAGESAPISVSGTTVSTTPPGSGKAGPVTAASPLTAAPTAPPPGTAYPHAVPPPGFTSAGAAVKPEGAAAPSTAPAQPAAAYNKPTSSSGSFGPPPPPPPTTGPILPGPATTPKKSPWAVMGWVVPLVGLPAIVYWYQYQQDVQKEGDQKLFTRFKEIVALTHKKAAAASAGKPEIPKLVSATASAKTEVPAPTELTPTTELQDHQPRQIRPPSAGEAIGPDSASGSAPDREVQPPQVAGKGTVWDPLGPGSAAAGADKVLRTTATGQQITAQDVIDSVEADGGKPVEVLSDEEIAAVKDAADRLMPPKDSDKDDDGSGGPSAPVSAGVRGPADVAPPPDKSAKKHQDPRFEGVVEHKAAAASPNTLKQDAHAAATATAALAPPGGYTAPALASALGADLDLTPVGLVRHALEAGGEAEWATFPQRHRQALADAELIADVLGRVQAWHEAEVAKIQRTADSAATKAAAIEQAAERAAEGFRSALAAQRAAWQERTELESRKARELAHLDAAKAAVEERAQRSAELDQVRLSVNALAQAHEHRVDQVATSRAGHAISVAAAALAAAADAGASLVAPAAVLASGPAGADPLVDAVMSVLPKQAVLTRSQLELQFRRLRIDLAALSYFPGNSSGLLAHAVARLAGKLKVDESRAVGALGLRGGGVDAALSQAEALLAAGRLGDAADLLGSVLKGTAAAALISGWLEEVRKRATVDVAVSALTAHATALSASLA